MRILFGLLVILLLSKFVHAGPPIIWGCGADTAKLLTTNLSDKTCTAFPTASQAQAAVNPISTLDTRSFHFSDFLNSSTTVGFNGNGSGAASGAQWTAYGIDTTENANGAWEIITGTDTTGRYTLLGPQVTLANGSFAFDYIARIAFQAASTAGQTYTAYVGFIDTIGAGDHTNGAYFRYTHGTNSGEWECVTASAGSRTARDSNVVGGLTTYDSFRITSNQAGTTWNFYINGTLVCGSPISSGNIPASNVTFGWGQKIEKSAGTTSRSLYTDYMGLYISRSSAR